MRAAYESRERMLLMFPTLITCFRVLLSCSRGKIGLKRKHKFVITCLMDRPEWRGRFRGFLSLAMQRNGEKLRLDACSYCCCCD